MRGDSLLTVAPIGDSDRRDVVDDRLCVTTELRIHGLESGVVSLWSKTTGAVADRFASKRRSRSGQRSWEDT